MQFVGILKSTDDLNQLIATDYYSIYELAGQIPKNAPINLKNPYGIVLLIGNLQQTQYIITDSVILELQQTLGKMIGRLLQQQMQSTKSIHRLVCWAKLSVMLVPLHLKLTG